MPVKKSCLFCFISTHSKNLLQDEKKKLVNVIINTFKDK